MKTVMPKFINLFATSSVFFATSAVKTVSLNRKARKGFRKGRKYCGRTFQFCNPHDALSRRRAQLIQKLVTLSHLVRRHTETGARGAIIGPENSPKRSTAVRPRTKWRCWPT